MEQVSATQIKDVVAAKNMTHVAHHRCALCGYQTGYDIDGDVVTFDAGCDCTGRYSTRPSSFADIAETFNIQKPEIRARMWDDFQAGNPLID